MKSGRATNKDKRVSIAAKNVVDIQPVVYSFRVPGHGPPSGSVMTAIRPPSWLYHDHALGVIWMLFHDEKNYIGITQLHWCLRFLLDLKNSEGEFTGDVDICIQAIQDDLIEQYAKLGTILEKPVEEKTRQKSKDAKGPDEISTKERNDVKDDVGPARSMMKIENQETTENSDVNELVEIKQEKESINSVETDPNKSINDNQEKLEDENFAAGIKQEIIDESKPIEEEEPGTSKSREKNEHTKDTEEKCDPIRCGMSEKKKMEKEIVSYTYNGMIWSGPSPCTEQYSIDDLFNENIFVDHEKTDDEMVEDGVRLNLADESTREMVNFLNSSRQQHIERIKKEIERLYGLERFMENLNANEFSAYVTEDLAKRIKSLKNEEIVKEADEITR